jgi:very-short-patch-repair endonuclease
VIGGRDIQRLERMMAAVLACGPYALLSHQSAAELWRIQAPRGGRIEVSVPMEIRRRPAGIRVHRRSGLSPLDRGVSLGISVTSPTRTLVDLSARVKRAHLEAAVNEADKLDLVHPEQLRSALERMKGQDGVARLRKLLDRRNFRLTDSDLERRFLSLIRSARLPQPETGQIVNGFRVDFYWRELGLIVETDGLRYHRTTEQQARDRRRDQVHTAAGLTTLRFTHAQVRYESAEVRKLMASVIRRITGRRQAA